MNDNENIRYNNFIEKLYNSPSSTPQDKERIVKLLLSEREQGFMTEERVRELIKEFVSITPQIGNEKEFYHNPRNMVKFLYQFSVNDIFKWFTHAPDPNMEFDYSTYLSTAESEYNKYAKSANRATWGNVRNFIFNTSIAPKDSFNKKIDFSWRDLKEWCLNNRNIHPYNSIVGDYRFARYIETFKNTIEFRTDKAEYLFSNRLEDFIYDYMLNQSDIKIKFDEPGNVDTLTGTMVQLLWNVSPDNATYKNVQFIYNEDLKNVTFVKDSDGNELGLMIFTGKCYVNLQIVADDGSRVKTNVVVWAY